VATILITLLSENQLTKVSTVYTIKANRDKNGVKMNKLAPFGN